MTARATAQYAILLAIVLLFPLVGLPRDGDRGSLQVADLYLFAADVLLVALTLLTSPDIIRKALSARSLEGALWPVVFTLVAIAFLIHPGPWGADRLIRLAGAAAVCRAVADLSAPRRRRVAIALGATAAIQAVVGIAQVASGHPLGLEALGELAAPLASYPSGPPMARGTLGHEFILAALALVAASLLLAEGLRSRGPAAWWTAAAVAIVPAGLIYGRTVVVSVALVVGSLLASARRDVRYVYAAGLVVLATAVPAALLSAGWAASLGRGVATDRVPMLTQALAIIGRDPLFGVGPGNYLDTLKAAPELLLTAIPQNVHDVPLMVAAEAGIPAGTVSLVLLALIALRSLRAGPPASTIFLAYVPWLLIDALPYVTPQGLVLAGLWLGFLAPRATRDGDTAQS